MDKVIAIQNYGISGTNFLQSLLDGHQKILSLPALYGRPLLQFWEQHNHLPKDELFTKFINEHPSFFGKTNDNYGLGLADMGVNHNEIACVDREKFKIYLSQEWQCELTRKHFITSIYIAYNKALGRNIDKDAWLLYPIHCLPERFGKQLAEDFSIVRFIHTLREPVQNIGSLCNHISKNSAWNCFYLLDCAIGQIFCDYFIHSGTDAKAFGLTPYLPDTKDGKVKTRAMKLEDIHQHPYRTLNKLCQFLEIEWDICLLQSTFDGKFWHNRPETIRQTGIGKQTISQKHNHLLNKFDRFRLRYLATAINQFYGYSAINKRSTLLNFLMPFLLCLPFKMEFRRNKNLLKNYFRCRIKWLFPALFKHQNQEYYIPLLADDV